jgi:hypothetical protein
MKALFLIVPLLALVLWMTTCHLCGWPFGQLISMRHGGVVHFDCGN